MAESAKLKSGTNAVHHKIDAFRSFQVAFNDLVSHGLPRGPEEDARQLQGAVALEKGKLLP
jgi:hypothetical protein